MLSKRFCINFGIVIFLVTVCSFKAFSSSKDYSNVTVSSNKGQLIFFDKGTGEVFVYGQANGKFLYAWQIEDLGNDLIRNEIESVWQRNLGR